MNETIAQVLPVTAENRRKFEEFCFSLTAEQLERPVPDSTWLVKDFASHLGSLDALFVKWYGAVQNGAQLSMTQEPDGSTFDLDAWNDEHVAERRSWPIGKIFEEANANRAQLVEAMERLDEEQIGRLFHFSDPKRGTADIPLKAFLVGWAQHDPIHVADMIKALPERAADADLHAWLAHPFVTGYQASMSGVKKA